MTSRPIRLIGAACAFAWLTAGCANQNSIFRVTDTEKDKTETILIDAKQRPITVNTNKDKQKTCLARSADALSQAAASGNLKITQASGGSGELGFADTETVTSIAFRTQVTEAQQEFLYYICQLNANGVLPDGDVADNLKHFQNTMLAMVAIDDLAAAGKASAAAAAKAKPDETKATSEPTDKEKAAQTKADEAFKTADTARGKVDSAESKLWLADTPKKAVPIATQLAADLKMYNSAFGKFMSAMADLQKAVQAEKGASAKAPDEVNKASTALTTAAKAVSSQYDKASKQFTAMIKEQDAKKFDALKSTALDGFTDYRSATDAAVNKAESLETSLTAWITAKDDTKPAQNAKDGTGSDSSGGSSAAVAQAVTSIVQTIVWQSFVGEKCQAALFGPKTTVAAMDDRVIDFCIQHLENADIFRFAALQSVGDNSNKPLPPFDMQQFKEALKSLREAK